MIMKKKRKLVQDEVSVSSEMVTYFEFFHGCLSRGLVKSWQEKEIHLFFKDLGLKDKESSDKYLDALAKY